MSNGSDGNGNDSRWTLPLSSTPRVEVMNIPGEVIIETHDSITADVQIIHVAKRWRGSKDNLVAPPDPTATGLLIKGIDNRAAERRGVTVEVRLRIPRESRLEVRNISGSVRIDELYESLKVEQVSSSLELGLAENLNADLTAKRIGGGLYINLSNGDRVDPDSAAGSVTRRIGAGGIPILISQVSGSVVIRR